MLNLPVAQLQRKKLKRFKHSAVPIVCIVVPFFGLTNAILRIPKGNPKKEVQCGDDRS